MIIDICIPKSMPKMENDFFNVGISLFLAHAKCWATVMDKGKTGFTYGLVWAAAQGPQV